MLLFPRKPDVVMISCLFSRKTQDFVSFLLGNRGARACVMISRFFSRKTQEFVPFLLENRGARACFFPLEN